MGIDSNAHSDIWGHSNNKRGYELVDYIIQEGFELHNTGKTYTYECNTGKSVIDLTLSWNLKTGLTDWKVSREINHSDHNSIKYNLETELETIPLHRPWNKADWEVFKKDLADKKIYIPKKITPHRLEKMLDQYYKQIEKALDKACPKQKEIIINKNNPWHKGTLKQLRIEKFARYKKYVEDRNQEENKNKYYQTLAKYRKLCRQKQKSMKEITLKL